MRWNPVLGGDTYRRIDDRGLTGFKHQLEAGHLDVTVRATQGKDIDAACGQLWTSSPSSTRCGPPRCTNVGSQRSRCSPCRRIRCRPPMPNGSRACCAFARTPGCSGDVAEPALEQGAFTVVSAEPHGTGQLGSRLVVPPQPQEQLTADAGEQM